MTKYRIIQDRFCWCGRAASLVVMRGENLIEPVCSENHGQITIEQLVKKESREREKADTAMDIGDPQ